MQDKDIRQLFQKAEIQVCPEQKRILKMYGFWWTRCRCF